MSGWAAGLEGRLLAWLAYRAGQKSQRASDDAQSLVDAQQARKIDDSVRGMSDAALDSELRQPPGPKR